MAKCVRWYEQNNRYHYMIARSEGGSWFYREWGVHHINATQMAPGWSKWSPLGKLVDISVSRGGIEYDENDREYIGRDKLVFEFDHNIIIVIDYNENHNARSKNGFRLPH